jgi:ABC-type antimicrobial peptide transport system permease subunit
LWSIRVALISLCGSAVGVWLATLLGSVLALLAGLLAWLVAWPIGVGLAVGALRNAWSSPTPESLRRKAWLGISISVFSLILVLTYIIALSVAANRLLGE